MSTHVPGSFSSFLHHSVLAKLVTSSIMVKVGGVNVDINELHL